MKRSQPTLAGTGSLFTGGRGAAPGQRGEMTQLFDGASFGAVFESSGEALVVVDPRGYLLRVNLRSRQLLRLSGEGVRDANLAKLISAPEGFHWQAWFRESASGARENKDDQEFLPRHVDGALANGFPIRVILRAVLPGTDRFLLCMDDGAVVQRAEERTQQLQAELSSLLDALEAGVILFDPSGRIRFANARFAQLFGLKLGLNLHGSRSLQTHDELEALVAARLREPQALSHPWKQFTLGEETPSHDELEVQRPVRKVLERYSRPVLGSDRQAAGWLELYYDVTAKREIQSKLLQTEKMAALGQLVSGIAHELNNPLTTIMGYAQLLLGHGLAVSQQAEAGKVFQEAERARRIVKNLLYFARENRPERKRVDINEIVERTLALRSYELRVEDIVVECDLAPGLPETTADPYQLQQVVLNLLVNAEQAILGDRGRGHVWIRTHRTSNERIALEISDDGPGILASVASRVFDPFFTTKPSGVGTGLGLSIVYGIVQQHGGEVILESQRGAGAKFIVELPLVAAAAGEEIAAPPIAANAANTRGRILVVEDEATVAQLVADVLSEEGHEVEATVDSQEGLTRISRSRFDLVICDLRMPRLDGLAFYDALVRAGSPIRDRIIFITGDTLAPRSIEFLESHRLPYLAKPFLVEELKLAVGRMLDRNHDAGGAGGHARAGQNSGFGTG